MRNSGVITFVVALVILSMAPVSLSAAAKPPEGAVAHDHLVGKWAVSCESPQGMVVAFFTTGPSTAVGKVAALGAGGSFHYRPGDAIFELRKGASGSWVGRFQWRDNSGIRRSEPVRLVADGRTVHATRISDPCYTRMPRAR